jgi:uncharacterized protein YjbI with pentapeptide repeats
MKMPIKKVLRCAIGVAIAAAAMSSQAVTINGCVIVVNPNAGTHTDCPGVDWSNQDLQGLDLRFAVLSDANMSNAKLANTDLSRSTLTGANLTGSTANNNTNFNRANMTNVLLTNANYTNATMTQVTLTGATLSGGNFTNVDFTNNTVMQNAIAINATFSGADLTNANLSGTNFSGSKFTSIITLNADGTVNTNNNTLLDNANMNGANFTGADLTGASMQSSTLTNANFTNAVMTCVTSGINAGSSFCTNLTNSNLTNANLTNAEAAGARFVNADMTGTTLNGLHAIRIRTACPAVLPANWHCLINNDLTLNQNLVLDLIGPGADVSNADLSHASMSGFDLSNVNFTNTNLSYADLSSTTLTGATFTDANLMGANLSSADLAGDNLDAVNLYGANLSGADISSASLISSVLTNCNLTNANLVASDLTAANLNGANLTGSDLTDANLTDAMLTGAIFDNTTLVGATLTRAILPTGTLPSGNGDNALATFGAAVAVADMNKDGYDDVIVGAPLEDVLPVGGKMLKDAGAIRIISGKDNTVLRTLNGTTALQRFGSAIAVVADQNTDGNADLVVGEPLATVTIGSKQVKKVGRVALYSGVDGALIGQIAQGVKAGDQFGAAVTVGDDQNTGTPDLIVGAPYADVVPVGAKALRDAGQITVFTGLTSMPRYTRNGTQAGEHFGAAVAVDADNQLLAGSPTWDATAIVGSKSVKVVDAGKVQVFPGVDSINPALFLMEGSVKGDRLGSAVSGAGTDIDHDGNADWLVGIPGYDFSTVVNLKTTAYTDLGKVLWLSGLNATPVLSVIGASVGENYGAALSATGDVDNDSTSDLVIAAPKYNVSVSNAGVNTVLKSAGRVETLSGVTLLSK